jgi:hypothetical protein
MMNPMMMGAQGGAMAMSGGMGIPGMGPFGSINPQQLQPQQFGQMNQQPPQDLQNQQPEDGQNNQAEMENDKEALET